MNYKNIVITGASKGIGYATALRLAEQPQHRVWAIARSAEALETLRQEALQKNGQDNLRPIVADVRDTQGIAQALAHLERIDILLNNAGFLEVKPFIDTLTEDWQQSFEVNFLAVVRLLQALYPQLRASGQAHVLNVGSMGGFQGSSKFAGLAAYSSAKAALANLSELLAEEWRPEGIAVNCLALGAVHTEMLATAFPGYQAPIDAATLADFMAYFACKGHLFFNGKVLPVALSTP
jgi:NAD(P)-dependent dehydrogenase (short-subunit alcohol dehydrogenase family)